MDLTRISQPMYLKACCFFLNLFWIFQSTFCFLSWPKYYKYASAAIYWQTILPPDGMEFFFFFFFSKFVFFSAKFNCFFFRRDFLFSKCLPFRKVNSLGYVLHSTRMKHGIPKSNRGAATVGKLIIHDDTTCLKHSFLEKWII